MAQPFLDNPNVVSDSVQQLQEIQADNGMENSDEKIIKRINKGDIKAFEYLFRAYHSNLCNYCFVKVKDKDAAKEIVQEIFINIYKNRENWSPKNSIKSYLFKAVKNRIINYLKHPSLSQKSELLIDSINNEKELSPIELYSQKEFREAYLKAVEKLPEKCREILMLVKEHGLSYKETAEIQDISIKTVETQMRLAFQKLRKSLKKFR
ncbi:MAG: RNA polymerase sigma-70 factor [Ignavibacteria bacterium]|jgi:RNA polymerase sigma-70 factor (ECF subfamily)